MFVIISFGFALGLKQGLEQGFGLPSCQDEMLAVDVSANHC